MQRRSRRVLAAVLFTDIVNSTGLAGQLGDRRWKELIARHHAIVRRALKRHGGRELDTAGDGFFASFGEPAASIRCASEVAAAVRQLGIEIRAGVHFGECEQIGRKLVGLSVVIGSRVMSLGGPGDVLVTGTTRELVGGAGFGFEDRGPGALKGVQGSWSVYAVTSVDGRRRPAPLPEEEASALRERIAPSPLGRRSRRTVGLVLVAAVVAALMAVVGGRLVLLPEAEVPLILARDAVAAFDPASGELRVQATLGGPPGGIVVGSGAIWVSSSDEGVLRRIDPSNGSVSDVVPNVGARPTALAYGDSSIWVVDEDGRAVRRVDPETGVAAAPIEVGNGPVAIAYGSGAAWVLNATDGTVSRIDPERSEVTDVIPAGSEPTAIAASDDAVWVTLRSSRTLLRVDPGSRTVDANFDVGDEPSAVTATAGFVWVANAGDRTLSRIRPRTGETEIVPVGDPPAALVAVGGAIWAALPEAGAIARIDPATGTTTRSETGGAPLALAQFEDEIWVGAGAERGTHRGGVLHLVRAADVPSLDPAVFSGDVISVLSITNDGLVGFRRTGGPAGAELVPNLAVALPRPTEGGRTWTLTMRQGIRYSDGTPVQVSHVRYGLERSLALAEQPPDLAYIAYGNIVGAAACLERPGSRCDLSEGIVVDDEAGRITFKLLEPDPAFLNLLALTLAYPVPPSVPADETLEGEASPATGPYEVETYEPGTLRLVRNDVFRVWSSEAKSDGYPDEIVWTTEPSRSRRIQMVEAGDADGFSLWRFEEPHVRLRPRTLDRLAFGPWDVHPFTLPSIDFYFFRSDLPPLDDERVRRAINLAIDREYLASRVGIPLPGFMTCQGIPPNIIGYRPYCPHTADPNPHTGLWSGTDLERARQLVREAGAVGAKILVDLGSGDIHRDQAEYMLGLLRRIGLRSSLTADPTRAHIGASGFLLDFPSPYQSMSLAVDCRLRLTGFCDRVVEADVRRAAELERIDPAMAGELYASIDRRLTDQARIGSIATGQGIDVVADSVGNYQHHVISGMLVDQLWVR